jgi:hypothetical protein
VTCAGAGRAVRSWRVIVTVLELPAAYGAPAAVLATVESLLDRGPRT